MPPFGSGGRAHSLSGEGLGESQFRRGDIHAIYSSTLSAEGSLGSYGVADFYRDAIRLWVGVFLINFDVIRLVPYT